MTRVLVIAAIGLAVILLVVALVNGGSASGPSSSVDAVNSTPARIAMMLGSLLLVGGGAVAAFRNEGLKALRYVAVWIGIGCLLALLYTVLYPNGAA